MQLTHKKTYYYHIDVLRSSMLLLGVVLHAGLSFIQFPLGEAWPYKHTDNAAFFDVLMLFIHTFRVPVFFVLAGFFIEMNMAQKSRKHLFIKKLKRIGIPLVLGVLFLFPLVEFGLEKALNNNQTILTYIANFDGSHYATIHLWFLYYLLFFYTAHLLISPMLKKIRLAINKINNSYFALLIFVFMGYAILVLNFVNPRSFDGDYALLPNVGSVIYFLGFYVLGFVFYNITNLFLYIQKQYTKYFVVGLIAFSVLLSSRSYANIESDFSLFENILFVVTAYSLVVGFFGLFTVLFKNKTK